MTLQDQLAGSARHWPAKRLKFVAPAQTDRATASPAEPDYIGLENIESWTGQLLENGSESLQEDDGESTGTAGRFVAGDVLFSKLRPYLAKAYLADHEGVCSTEFLVLRPTPELDGRFLRYFFLIPHIVAVIDSSTFGAKMPRANWDFIGSLSVPLPERPVQRRIADYLDAETAEMDALISEKERMLALLEEKRAAVVTQAVTRGLDPQVKLKPSDLDWLGDIPARWSVRRLKFLIDGIDQGWSPRCFNFPAEKGQWGVLKTGCVNGGVFREQENKVLPDDIDPPKGIEVGVGDMLMSRASGSIELIGAVARVVNQPKARLLLSDKTFRLRPTTDILDADFLVAAMGSRALRHQIKAFISGAEGLANNIARSDIDNLMIPLPPLEEQQDIAAHIRLRTREAASLIKSLSASLSLLRERRSALIAAAVTGQIPIEEMTV